MNKILLSILILCFLSLPTIPSQYGLHTPQEFKNNFESEQGERILFILDFSNSMTEPLEGSRKVDLLINTM